jgi:POT family proton-dependent oligopeptide transporter
MWERFSYYGMRALLILYLTKFWLFSDGKANLIYGAYTSLVYITPVLGGWLADRYLGQRKAVLFGGILLAFGHLLMAVEGQHGLADPLVKQADPAINVFWLALSFIIVGSGFLKANISVIVGQLYRLTDVRRDGAYTIFYMGVNVGSALGTILVGYLGETIGWAYGFGLAGIGMVCGLIIFVLGKPALRGRGEPSDPARLAGPTLGVKLETLLYAVGVLAVVVIWLLIQYQNLIGYLLGYSGIVLLGYVLLIALFALPYGRIRAGRTGRVWATVIGLAMMAYYLAATKFDLALGAPVAVLGLIVVLGVIVLEARSVRNDLRDRLLAVLFLILLEPVFWGHYEQSGGSFNLFTDRFVDRGGVPTSLFQSINPIYIIILGPVFAWMWTALGKRGLEPSTPAKFALGLIQVGLSFLVLVWGAEVMGGPMIAAVLVFLLYLLQTTGELCLSPVGLSAMNRLAPKAMASLIMGAWFFATAGGEFLAGKIGQAIGGEGGEMTKEASLVMYDKIGWIGVGLGIAVLIVAPLVKRLMHLDTLRDEEVGDDLLGREEAGYEAEEAGMHPQTRPQ